MKMSAVSLIKIVLLTLLSLWVLIAIINSSIFDEQPSAQLKQLNNIQPLEFRTDNRYFTLYGLAADNQTDATQAGIQLVKRYLANREKNGFDDLKEADYEQILGDQDLDKAWQAALPSCNARTNIHCASTFIQQTELEPLSSARFKQMQQRYQRMLAQPNFKEIQSMSLATPLPSYGLLINLARAQLIKQYQTGSLDSYLDLMQQDMTLWRHMLQQGDHLISRMVAVAALWNNLQLLAETLQSHTLSEQQLAKVQSITASLSQAELNLKPALEFEVKAFLPPLEDISKEAFDDIIYMKDWLYQETATQNRVVNNYQAAFELAELSGKEFYNRHQNNNITLPKDGGLSVSIASLYNPAGKLLSSEVLPRYQDYIARVHDLNTMFYLTQLAITLQEDSNTPLGDQIKRSELNNPNNGKAFDYDQRNNTVGFDCLDDNNKCKLPLK